MMKNIAHEKSQMCIACGSYFIEANTCFTDSIAYVIDSY